MRFAETQVVTIANQKQGSAKTTCAVSLAAAFAARKYTVCLIDLDPHCVASTQLGVKGERLLKEGRLTALDIFLSKRAVLGMELPVPLAEVEGRLVVVPAHRGLSQVGARLEGELSSFSGSEGHSLLEDDQRRDEQRQRLRKAVQSIAQHYDVVVVDTPPELGLLTTAALIAADWLLAPLVPARYDLKALEDLGRAAEQVRKRYNPELKLAGVLLCNCGGQSKLEREVEGVLRSRCGPEALFETRIGAHEGCFESRLRCQTVFSQEGWVDAATQYDDLVKEMLLRGRRERPLRPALLYEAGKEQA